MRHNSRKWMLWAGAAASGLLFSATSYAQGNVSFEPAQSLSIGAYPNAVIAADLNGDGRPDLAGTVGGRVLVFLGNGDRTFQAAQSFASGGSGSSIAVADFNGDEMSPAILAT